MPTIGEIAVKGSEIVAAVPVPSSNPDEVLAQSEPPAEAFHGADALAQALASRAPWIWLLGPRVRPRPDALERLVQCARPSGEPPASLLAGMVIDGAGGAVGPELPAGGGRELADVVRLAGRSLLPIRHSSFANCLVARQCFLDHGFPEFSRYGRYAPAEWSARVLRSGAGYFVPASIAVHEGSASRQEALASIPALARMARTGVFTRGETLAAVRLLTGELIAGAGAPPAPPQGATPWRPE